MATTKSGDTTASATETKRPRARKPTITGSGTDQIKAQGSMAGIKTAVKEAEKAQSAAQSTVANDTSSAPALATNEAPKHERKVDAQGRAQAVGKRKNAVARVWIKPGNGKITVNGRDVQVYFARPVLQMIVNQPFTVADRANQFDVDCIVDGGGLSGQAGAVKHGISKALTFFEPDLRKPLKTAMFLRRDARVVERKKYGRAKARKRFQFSKR